MIRIMLVDNHLLLRQTVREIVNREPDLEVVAEAGDGEIAVKRVAEVQPHVILMDLNIPVCNGFEATQRILACSPASRVVIFSASTREEDALRALQCGAIGYITKDTDADGLLTALRRAAHNDLYMAHPLATRLLALLRTLLLDALSLKAATTDTQGLTVAAQKQSGKCLLALTEREQQVLHLIRQGQRNREIARELRIAESTVHKHVQNIFRKLDARNRVEALFLTGA